MVIASEVTIGVRSDFLIHSDGSLRLGSRVCVPEGVVRDELLSAVHSSSYSVHPGGTKMYKDLRQHFWWRGMKQDIAVFVSRCLVCQQVKAEHQRVAGMLQPLPIPQWKWEHIAMDFVSGLPRSSKGNDAIWIIVDRLTKSAHFLPFRLGQSTEILARRYMDTVVRLHGVPHCIVSDRDSRFTSHFWRRLQDSLGTLLTFSTAHHPQTDGQSERTIQTLEDMLRACMIDFGGSWEDHLYLAEFSYNNSYHASIKMAPFEALYGRRCRSPLCWDDIGERLMLAPELIEQTVEKVRYIREQMRVSQDRQKRWANLKMRPVEFEQGDHVFLKISPVRGVIRFVSHGKLNPRFIGLFQILERVGEVAYRLALPLSLVGVHDVFHVSQLKRYVHDPTHVLDHTHLTVRSNMTYEESPVSILDRCEKVLKTRVIPLVRVRWGSRAEADSTWEREDEMRQRFPDLFVAPVTS